MSNRLVGSTVLFSASVMAKEFVYAIQGPLGYLVLFMRLLLLMLFYLHNSAFPIITKCDPARPLHGSIAFRHQGIVHFAKLTFSWDKFYSLEKRNFEENEDVGEVWFGTGVERRLVDYFVKNVPLDSCICDVGCGNAHFLHRLKTKNYVNLVGTDYSEHALELARLAVESDIKLVQLDLLDASSGNLELFDVVCDKGTWDAISLMPTEEPQIEGDDNEIIPNRVKSLFPKYISTVARLVRKGGLFVITSCNWTKMELLTMFSEPYFSFKEEILHPSFSFGGSKGQTVTTVVFTRKME